VDEEKARRNLRQRLHRLKDALGVNLILPEDVLQLDPRLEVDVVRLESGVFTGDYPSVLFLISNDPNSFDFDYYVGPGLQFTPHSNAQGATATTPLKPGPYGGALWAFSGAGNNNFSVSDNITGVGLSGRFYSFSQARSVNFTLVP